MEKKNEKDLFSVYLQDINKNKILSREEEIALVKLVQAGDKKAEKKFILANLRFVISVAKRYVNSNMLLSDLVSIGNIGLITAARRFNLEKNTKFISYAIWWIRQSILQAISKESRLTRLPMNHSTGLYNYRKSIIKLEQKLHRNPSIEEIAEDMKKNPKEVVCFYNVNLPYLSLDMPMNEEKENNLLEKIAGHFEHDDDVLKEERLHLIEETLKSLTIREKEVIRLYFGYNKEFEYTLNEIANTMNLTKERIRQLKEKALRKMKQAITNRKFYDVSINGNSIKR